MKNKILIIVLSVIFVACSDDFLDHESEDLVSGTQFNDFANASPENALLILESNERAQYGRFKDGDATDLSATHTMYDLMADKTVQGGFLFSNGESLLGEVQRFYHFEAREQNDRQTEGIWGSFYKTIFDVNLSLNLINESDNELFTSIRARFHALRAFSYFRLAMTYQQTIKNDPNAPGVPTYDGNIENDDRTRATLQKVYDLILSDIEFAYNNIDDYARPDKDHLDKRVIAGLYARILLETGIDYELCASLAREAQSEGSLMSETQWGEGFNDIDNPEIIWGGERNDAPDSIFYLYHNWAFSSSFVISEMRIDKKLYESIPDTDYRKNTFNEAARLKSSKFSQSNSSDADYLYMRVGEMYLVEAEALARSGSDAQAAQILFDLVSERDSAYTLSTNTGEALLDEIYHQRKIELWGEGHGLFDLKRFGKGINRDYPDSNHWETDGVLLNLPAEASKFVLQIPLTELVENLDINESDQNPF